MTENKKSVLIIGAGISGLPIGLNFCKKGYEVTILEKSSIIGGIATSIKNKEGYTMDIGPHYITLPRNSETTLEIYDILGKENVEELSNGIRRDRKAFFRGKFWNEFPNIAQFMKNSGKSTWVNFGIDFCFTKLKKRLGGYKSNTVKDYLISNYGGFLYNNWFIPYFQNLYYDKIPSLEFVQKQFPPLNLKKSFSSYKKSINASELTITKDEEYFNCYFKGGMISLITGLQNKIESLGGKIITNSEIQSIEHGVIKKVTYKVNNYEKFLNVDIIVYALPLNIANIWFDKKIKSKTSPALNSIIIYLFIDLPKVYDNWIIDFYEKNIIFWRISQPTYLSKSLAPKNKSIITIEIRVLENNPLWKFEKEKIYSHVCKELKKIKLVDLEKIENYKIIKLKNFYPLEPKSTNIEEIKHNIESNSGEYASGLEIDFGVSVNEEGTKTSNPRLGGVFRAISHAKILTEKIIRENS